MPWNLPYTSQYTSFDRLHALIIARVESGCDSILSTMEAKPSRRSLSAENPSAVNYRQRHIVQCRRFWNRNCFSIILAGSLSEFETSLDGVVAEHLHRIQ
jgi:hypothetical protein